VLDLFAAGRPPENLGHARLGRHGEPEELREWARRQGVPYAAALRLYRNHKLPTGIVYRRTTPQLEWFQHYPGIKSVLLAQAEHGHAIIAMDRALQTQLARLRHWAEKYRVCIGQLERQRKRLRTLYSKHWTLRMKIKRAEDAYRRGDIPMTLSDMDELKERLFGPDLVMLEMARRRSKGKPHGPQAALSKLRQASETDSGA
jgi:hypothetical protein